MQIPWINGSRIDQHRFNYHQEHYIWFGWLQQTGTIPERILCSYEGEPRPAILQDFEASLTSGIIEHIFSKKGSGGCVLAAVPSSHPLTSPGFSKRTIELRY